MRKVFRSGARERPIATGLPVNFITAICSQLLSWVRRGNERETPANLAANRSHTKLTRSKEITSWKN